MGPTPVRCLITIGVCTWSAIHPNIPAQDLEDHEAVLGQDVSHAKLRKALKRFAKRLRLTILAIIFPEFFLGRAWADRQAASESVKDFDYYTASQGREADWTTTHAFYANMGGFILKVRKDALTDDQRHSIADWQQRVSELRPSWAERSSGVGVVTRSSCFRLKMLVQVHWLWTYATSCFRNQAPPGQLRTLAQDRRYIAPVTICYLNADQILVLRKSEVLRTWPQLAESYIEDKSDANVVGKGISIVTIIWLVVTILWQLRRGLTITPIEATAMSHASVALITYGLWFGKPLDVNTSTTLEFDHTKLNKDTLRDLEEESGWSFINEQRRHDLRLPIHNDIDWRGSALSYSFRSHSIGISYVDAGLWLGGVLFGCVHIGAFWYTFDKLDEKILWLIATTVIVLAIPLISVASLLLRPLRPAEGSVDHKSPGIWYHVTLALHYLGTVCYLAARAFLLVESGRSIHW